jgi:hypothetical protein
MTVVLIATACAAPPSTPRAGTSYPPRPQVTRSPAECMADRVAGSARDSASTLIWPPVPQRAILPPYPPPSSLRGRRVAIALLVTVDGRVDSVTFAGVRDSLYADLLRRHLATYDFTPAVSQSGCPQAAWFPIAITF